MNFWQWIVNKIRLRRYALSTNVKLLTFGAIYYGNYSNWKHDMHPLIWIQYSDPLHTHAINIHYLNSVDKRWFANTIYLLKRAQQRLDGRIFYTFLKARRPNIPKIAYRVYFTNLLNMRLVSAGITPLDKLIYTNFADPWVAALNQLIRPSEMKTITTPIAYSTVELRERITEAMNSIDIRTGKVGQQTGPFGVAPWKK
jgi:hypothetical protein